MLESPDTLIELGDGGAHCGLICDASLPTYMLWRWSDIGAGGGNIPIGQLVRALTAKNAAAIGLTDRGQILKGLRAGVNVIDPKKLMLKQPAMIRDLPEGREHK